MRRNLGIVKGARWGKMTCIRAEIASTPIMASGGPQGKYETGDYIRKPVIELKCDCGNIVTLESFPGRRKIMSCGECDAEKVYDLSVSRTITMPEDVIGKVSKWARKEKINFSHQVTLFCIEAMTNRETNGHTLENDAIDEEKIVYRRVET